MMCSLFIMKRDENNNPIKKNIESKVCGIESAAYFFVKKAYYIQNLERAFSKRRICLATETQETNTKKERT